MYIMTKKISYVNTVRPSILKLIILKSKEKLMMSMFTEHLVLKRAKNKNEQSSGLSFNDNV